MPQQPQFNPENEPPEKLFQVIYPRAWIECVVTFAEGTRTFETSPFGIAPNSVVVTHNPHHQADTCEAEVMLSALTFGSRTVNSIFVTAFIGVVQHMGDPIKSEKTLQFCGYADEISDGRSKNGPMISLKCRDLSALLRDIKPLITRKDANGKLIDPTPRYSDTVTSAIQRVLQWAQVPDTVLQISDPDNLGSAKLSASVSKREQTAYLPVKRDASAWEAIEHVAALTGLLIVVDRGNIVIKKSTDLIAKDKTAGTKYNFVFGFDGANVLDVEKQRKFIRNRKGVKVVAYDPKARRAISAVYPPDDQLLPKKRPKPKHTKHKHAPKAKKTEIVTAAGKTIVSTTTAGGPAIKEERDVFTFSLEGVSSIDQLTKLAARIYMERSTQEMEGSITTKNWTPELFDLDNGDRIMLTVTQRLEAELRNFNDYSRKIQFLKERLNVDEHTAQVLFRNTGREEDATPFYMRSIRHSWSPKDYSTHVDFINLMNFG